MNAAGSKRVAITGASGYVGSALARRFERDGWTVTGFSRSAAGEVRFRLGEDVDPDAFRSRRIDALVHTAYDFTPVDWKDIRHVNVVGSQKLLAAAKAGGASRMVVLSSISAFRGCRSLYGRAKLEIEEAASDAGAAVVRPGLVFVDSGEQAGGMYGSLLRSARASLVPMIDGGAHCQYLIHVDDLYTLISGLCSGRIAAPDHPFTAASPRCWTMRELVGALALKQGARPRFVSVPWRVVWLGLKAAETARLRRGYRSDSVLSLVHQDPRPDFSTLHKLGVTPREFSA
ncbi:MAG TPA: NAD-dependent epimerase/dehydratase family protein [Candidatus Dormibacteraeota bacterium]|nr:NAD-dependent epimerase/dehydratase family protein [Candidatus Dormibacteraeota bacterium]